MKTIFITGASSDIGKATAEMFAANGWKVIATMRNPKKGKELAKLSNVVVMPLDVTNSGQIEEVCRQVLAKYDIDVLFNNAGYGIMAPLERIPEQDIRKLFDTDVIGTMLVTQQFIPHFKKTPFRSYPYYHFSGRNNRFSSRCCLRSSEAGAGRYGGISLL